MVVHRSRYGTIILGLRLVATEIEARTEPLVVKIRSSLVKREIEPKREPLRERE